jgi:restriction endonuclease
MEAYNKKLVKKISVKGVSVTGGTATDGYVYLQSVNVGKGNPTATIEFDVKGSASTRKATRVLSSLQLREIEKAKIHCAREHFAAISGHGVVYGVIDGYEALMSKVMR